MKYTYLLIIYVLFLASCTDVVIRESKDIDNSIWLYNDPFSTNFEIRDTKAYDIFFSIKHGDYYPFENIYLRITDDFSGMTSTDTVNINLSDNYGVWKGKGSSVKNYTALLRREYRFPHTGFYNIKIEQFTRTDSLKEVEQVSVFLQRTK